MVVDLEIESLDDPHVAVLLAHTVERQFGHGPEGYQFRPHRAYGPDAVRIRPYQGTVSTAVPAVLAMPLLVTT